MSPQRGDVSGNSRGRLAQCRRAFRIRGVRIGVRRDRSQTIGERYMTLKLEPSRTNLTSLNCEKCMVGISRSHILLSHVKSRESNEAVESAWLVLHSQLVLLTRCR